MGRRVPSRISSNPKRLALASATLALDTAKMEAQHGAGERRETAVPFGRKINVARDVDLSRNWKFTLKAKCV